MSNAHDNVIQEIVHEDSQSQNVEIDCFENFLRQCYVDMNINHVQTKAILRVRINVFGICQKTAEIFSKQAMIALTLY